MPLLLSHRLQLPFVYPCGPICGVLHRSRLLCQGVKHQLAKSIRVLIVQTAHRAFVNTTVSETQKFPFETIPRVTVMLAKPFTSRAICCCLQ